MKTREERIKGLEIRIMRMTPEKAEIVLTAAETSACVVEYDTHNHIDYNDYINVNY